MKKLIITAIALTVMAGSAIAQDNRVKVEERNAELIKHNENSKKGTTVQQTSTRVKLERDVRSEADSTKKATTTKRRLVPSKGLKIEDAPQIKEKPQRAALNYEQK